METISPHATPDMIGDPAEGDATFPEFDGLDHLISQTRYGAGEKDEPAEDTLSFGTESFDAGMREIDAAKKGDAPAEPAEEPKEEPAEAPKEESKEDAPAEPAEAPPEEPKEETQAADFSWLKDILPGAVVETAEDAHARVASLAERAGALGRFEEIVQQDAPLAEYLTNVLEKGLSPREAALKSFGKLAAAPDPEEDPEGYADYKAALAREEVRAEHAKSEAARTAQAEARLKEQDQKAFDAFTAAEKDLDAKTFLQEVQGLLFGDEVTGRHRADKYRVLYNGLNHERIVKEKVEAAVKAAEQEAFVRGVKSVKGTEQNLRVPPNPATSRSAPLSDADQKRQQFAREVLESDNWLDQLKRTGQYQQG